ncbi:MAG: hypothetical protein WDW20_01560, partial [Neisseriaceae bacterium]
GMDLSKMSDAQIITELQTYKRRSVDRYFRSSSPENKRTIKKRCIDEEKTLLELIRKKKK